MDLIRKGKVKEVFDAGGDELLFRYTDQISVFDKIIPSLIPYKGESLCRTSAFWFKHCAAKGIKTHFVKLEAGNEMRVQKFHVPTYEELTHRSTNVMIPLEWVCRHYVAGSLWDRVKSGEVSAEDLGFVRGKEIKYGDELEEPLVEVTTKIEKVDRKLDWAEAANLARMTKEELNEGKHLVVEIDRLIAAEVHKRGLIHVDGKKEFAFDPSRNFVLIDSLGTADEDRWWFRGEYEKGNFVEFSKEFVRQHYRSSGYHDELERARKAKQPEPDIPALPMDVVEKTSDLYVNACERITGERFR
jgi:phosphoribosylaminoimidazole-succinocarboxamide synthase